MEQREKYKTHHHGITSNTPEESLVSAITVQRYRNERRDDRVPLEGPPAGIMERAIRKRVNRGTARMCENLEAADARDELDLDSAKLIAKSELAWIADDLCEIAREADDGRGNR